MAYAFTTATATAGTMAGGPLFGGFPPGMMFPGGGAGPAVTVHLNGVSSNRRTRFSVQTVGQKGGSSSAAPGLGFDETFPPALAQLLSPSEWKTFISDANQAVERRLGGMYRWRYAFVVVPFLVIIAAMAIIIPVFMSGGGSMFLPLIAFFVVFAVLTTFQVSYMRVYGRKLQSALSDLSALCAAANQSTQPRGLTWSVKQASGGRRSLAVWLQGDMVVGAQQQPSMAAAATGYPVQGQPGPNTVPLPAYGTTGQPQAAGAADPLPWPVTAGGAPTAAGAGLSAPQYPNANTTGLNWPV